MQIHLPILVTGATGFIGGHLVDRLIREGVRPRVLVRGHPARVRARWGERVGIAVADLSEKAALFPAVAGAATVFHLAALVGDAGTLAEHRAATVEGTRHLLEAISSSKPRVVLTSSVAVYGTKLQTDVVDEDIEWGAPAGHYSACKQEQERLSVELARASGIPLTVVRPCNVYGPGSTQWVDAPIVELKRGTPVLVGGGDFNAGLCHVENLVEALLLAASRPEAIGGVYNVSDGSGVTWKRYFGDLAALAGTAPPKAVPRAVANALATLIEPVWRAARLRGRPPLTHEALNIVGSDHRVPTGRIERELAFSPVITYEQALPGIAAYVQERFPWARRAAA